MNKSLLLVITLVFGITSVSFLLHKENHTLDFNALYIGKTGEIETPGNKIEIFNYLRFYDDGTVITQAVSAYDPKAVSQWFHPEGRFERSGTYKISKNEITFSVSNDNSPDKKLEGARTDQYSGKILEDGQLELTIKYASGKSNTAQYDPVKIE